MKRSDVFGRCLLACVLLLGATASAYAQLPGAIFTTLSDGTRVNANIYSAKCGVSGVWLDGGPGPNAPQGAAGLPDGDYYFQVTDPSGKTLLSTDAVMFRQIHVSAGIISGLSGAGNHNTSFDVDHGAVTIELCPFNDTPNPGGVYKAWVTPIAQFLGDPTKVDSPNASCKNGCFHGFVPAFSKTDNFKVGSGPGAACLTVWKNIDVDGNGLRNSPPDYSTPWPVTITDPLGASNTFFTPFGTGKDVCTFAQLVPGLYSLTEATTNGSGNFILTSNRLDGKYLTSGGYPDTTVQIRIKDASTHELVFGNAPR
jgi:hypothetical protein